MIQSCLCLNVPVYYCRIHSWGNSLEEAFEQCAMGMFGYMTDTETVEPIDTVEVESEGERENETYLNHIYTVSLNSILISQIETAWWKLRMNIKGQRLFSNICQSY